MKQDYMVDNESNLIMDENELPDVDDLEVAQLAAQSAMEAISNLQSHGAIRLEQGSESSEESESSYEEDESSSSQISNQAINRSQPKQLQLENQHSQQLYQKQAKGFLMQDQILLQRHLPDQQQPSLSQGVSQSNEASNLLIELNRKYQNQILSLMSENDQQLMQEALQTKQNVSNVTQDSQISQQLSDKNVFKNWDKITFEAKQINQNNKLHSNSQDNTQSNQIQQSQILKQNDESPILDNQQDSLNDDNRSWQSVKKQKSNDKNNLKNLKGNYKSVLDRLPGWIFQEDSDSQNVESDCNESQSYQNLQRNYVNRNNSDEVSSQGEGVAGPQLAKAPKNSQKREIAILQETDQQILLTHANKNVKWLKFAEEAFSRVGRKRLLNQNGQLLVDKIHFLPDQIQLDRDFWQEPQIGIGAIKNVIGDMILVESSEETINDIAEGSLVFNSNSKSLVGIIIEVFGPFKKPYYAIRHISVFMLKEQYRCPIQVQKKQKNMDMDDLNFECYNPAIDLGKQLNSKQGNAKPNDSQKQNQIQSQEHEQDIDYCNQNSQLEADLQENKIDAKYDVDPIQHDKKHLLESQNQVLSQTLLQLDVGEQPKQMENQQENFTDCQQQELNKINQLDAQHQQIAEQQKSNDHYNGSTQDNVHDSQQDIKQKLNTFLVEYEGFDIDPIQQLKQGMHLIVPQRFACKMQNVDDGVISNFNTQGQKQNSIVEVNSQYGSGSESENNFSDDELEQAFLNQKKKQLAQMKQQDKSMQLKQQAFEKSNQDILNYSEIIKDSKYKSPAGQRKSNFNQQNFKGRQSRHKNRFRQQQAQKNNQDLFSTQNGKANLEDTRNFNKFNNKKGVNKKGVNNGKELVYNEGQQSYHLQNKQDIRSQRQKYTNQIQNKHQPGALDNVNQQLKQGPQSITNRVPQNSKIQDYKCQDQNRQQNAQISQLPISHQNTSYNITTNQPQNRPQFFTNQPRPPPTRPPPIYNEQCINQAILHQQQFQNQQFQGQYQYAPQFFTQPNDGYQQQFDQQQQVPNLYQQNTNQSPYQQNYIHNIFQPYNYVPAQGFKSFPNMHSNFDA